MYSGRQIINGLRHPNKVSRELNRLYFTRGGTRQFNLKGVDIFEADWDNLVILDACRYDAFARTVSGQWSVGLNRVTSRGSSTLEFLIGNLSKRSLLDTVYVTGNPQLTRIEQRGDIELKLHGLVDIWLDDGWDPEMGTVYPSTVVDYGIEAAEEYPNKRLVFHFLQPHYPFLSERFQTGQGHMQKNPTTESNFWDQIMRGDLSVNPEQIWEAYLESLERTLPHVRELITALSGKTVITSDHGNMIGERSFPIPIREWGHPPGIYTSQLVEVPWLELEDGPRRTITEGKNKEMSHVSEDVINDRLESLGYL